MKKNLSAWSTKSNEEGVSNTCPPIWDLSCLFLKKKKKIKIYSIDVD